jgi:hypothetical protein
MEDYYRLFNNNRKENSKLIYFEFGIFG